MEDIHFLNRHMCSPLYVSGAVIKARDTATNVAWCRPVCGSQSRGRQPSSRQLLSGVADAAEGSMQGLQPVIKDLNTWLQPFLLFLLSFAVSMSPSKCLMAVLSHIFYPKQEASEEKGEGPRHLKAATAAFGSLSH